MCIENDMIISAAKHKSEKEFNSEISHTKQNHN